MNCEKFYVAAKQAKERVFKSGDETWYVLRALQDGT